MKARGAQRTLGAFGATRLSEGAETWAAARVWLRESAGYLIVSLLALALDIGLLFLLVEGLEANLFLANALSFLCGATFVYLASIHLIFGQRRFKSAAPEFFIFVAIGVAGLGVNELVLWGAVAQFGLHYGLGKVAAAGASFSFNFVLRKLALFA
jgi:putative flippase GtrA